MAFSYTRREFLSMVTGTICSTTIASEGLGNAGILRLMRESEAHADALPLKESMYYKKLENLRIECQICPRKCSVADLERGYCGNKENRDGKYYTLVYSRPCAVHVDPIEKKPLFHYLPGTPALSIATAGCNIECKFCQNWQISQFRPEQVKNFDLPPEEIVRLAKEHKTPTIAYTYSEPVVFYTYMYDTARLAKKEGIGSVMISNGYIAEEPLVDLCKQLSAVKVDLKAFTEKFYKEICSGKLKPVLQGLETLKKIGIWYEIVVLIVPTLNDNEKEIREMSIWIKDHLGSEVPVHFSRFYPTYKIKNLPRTPVKSVERARKVAMEVGLKYVYLGNVFGHEGENTYCPQCGKVIIRRIGFKILEKNMVDGKCRFCTYDIVGVWS